MRRKRDEPLEYESFEDLLNILAEEQRNSLGRRKNRRIVLAVYGLVFCVIMLMLVLAHIHFAGVGNLIGPIVGITVGMFAVSAKQRKGIQALATFNDIRAVPFLVTALGYKDQNLQVTAANALCGLLPRLQASDAALLKLEHYALLNRALRNDLELKRHGAARLRIAILQALQQVGDASSLALVEEMAEGKGKAAGQPEVRQAAETCLSYLRLRAENQRQTQTLLRASDSSMTPVEMLLRPASEQPACALHADELLRVPASEAETQAVAQPIFITHEARQAEQQELRLH